MKKAAIAIDDWKLPIFEKNLKEAGYTFVQSAGVTKDSLILTVHTEDLAALGNVVMKANTEAFRMKMN